MAGTKERILLVENDPDISDVIDRRTLRPLGWDIQVVIDAAAAMKAALESPFDLIIADLNLPDLEGIDLLAALKAEGVHAPIVVISAKGEERRAIQAFRLGAVDALLWPVKEAEIVRVVERALQPTRSQQARRQLDEQLQTGQKELQRRTRELAALVALSRAATGKTEPDAFFRMVVESALWIAGADIAWLTLRDDKTGDYLLRAHQNLPSNWASKKGRPFEDGLSSLVSTSGRILVVHGKSLEKSKISALGKSAAVVPVRWRDQILGLIVIVRKTDREIERAARALLEPMAEFVSMFLMQSRPDKVREVTLPEPRPLASLRQTMLDTMKLQMVRLESLRSEARGGLNAEQQDIVAELEASIDQLMGLLVRTTASNPTKTK